MNTSETNLFSHLMAAGRPDAAVAIRRQDGASVTYAELARRSARCANMLREAGLARGERLIALTEKSVDAIVLYLATLRVGAVYVPLNPAYTDAELEYFVRDARPAVLVTDLDPAPDFAALCPDVPVRVLTLAEACAPDDGAPGDGDHGQVERASPDDVAAILYTSGTTGRSKGAMLTHRNLLSNAQTLREAWGFDEDDVLVHALPLFHTHGLFVGVNVSFLAGATVDLLARFDTAAIASRLPHATVLMGVPTYYTRLLEVDGLDRLCRGMRLFVSGSAPLLASTHERWRDVTGHEILERYGMTETTMLTSNPLDGERRPGTVGRPLPGVEVRISAPDDQGVGSIQVCGPNVFAGYWQMPERTKAEFTDDGFFITGDLGRFDDGYLQIIGREKDLVITGGYNVYPKEIESVIDAFDQVSESAVFGVADPDIGERVTAAVVTVPGALLDEAALRDHLSQRLARYKRPRMIVPVDSLPRNVMGKVQKNVLRAAHAQDAGAA